jgi:hypothetical protein
VTDDELLATLGRICRVLDERRDTVDAIAGAFIAEGRAFAATPEGRRAREALLGSDLLARARLLWEAFGLRRARAVAAELRPSRWIGAVAAASGHERAERVLSRLLTTSPSEDRR